MWNGMKISVLGVVAALGGCVYDDGTSGYPGYPGYPNQPPIQQYPPQPGYPQPGYPQQPGYPPPVIPPAQPPVAGRWVLLGQMLVDFKGDKDVMGVNPQYDWKRLQLTAEDGAIEVYGMRVHFANKDEKPYDVPIPQGYKLTRQNPSVIIELPKIKRRNITKIDFAYRGLNNVRNARLTVSGQ